MGKSLAPEQILRKGLIRLYNYWLDFVLFLIRLVGLIPFHHLRRLGYRLAGMKIGQGSSIHMFFNCYHPKYIQIGQDSVIGIGTFIDGRQWVRIGNHVAISSEVMIYNSQHAIDSEDFHPVDAPVTIEDYVFIGPRAIILPGVTIGKGAVVGAGAVVTKDVPPMTVVGGVPAKEIRKRTVKELNYRIGRARWFQ